MVNINDLLKSLQEDDEEKEKIDIPFEEFEVKITEKYTQEFLFENVKTYEDVCKYLKEDKEISPYLQIKQIAKLFNGEWKAIFDGKQKNYYPYFRCSCGFSFVGSHCIDFFFGMVSYYKNKEISDFIGKTFLDIYEKLSKSY